MASRGAAGRKSGGHDMPLCGESTITGTGGATGSWST
jgi:hypothetical protein